MGLWCPGEDVESHHIWVSNIGALCYWMGKVQRYLMWSKQLPKDVSYLQVCFVHPMLVEVEQAGLCIPEFSDGGEGV